MAGDLIKRFYDFLKLQEGARYSPNTITNYCRVAQHMEDDIRRTYGVQFDENDADKIKSHMLSPWVEHMARLKPATREQYSICSRVFLRFLFQNGYMSANLEESIPKFKEKSRKRYGESVDTVSESDVESDYAIFTGEEIQKMLDCSPNSKNNLRDRAIIMLLKSCGLRASEVASLTVKQFTVSYKGHVNCMGKGGRIEPVPVPSSAYEAVMAYLHERFGEQIPTGDNIPLFVSTHGNPMNRFSIYEALSARQKKCGLHTGVHRMRHTFITNVEKSYGPITAMNMARHHSLQITRRYVHTTIEEKLRIAEEIQKIKN